MNLVTSSAITMSSQQIADLVNSRHDSVRRTIERLAEKGVIQLPPLVEVKNHLGQTVWLFQVCKRDSFVVVAQLSPEFTAALVDRWQELENGHPVALPKSFADALRLAADQQEQIEQQAQQLAIAAPKVEFVDKYVKATGLKGFRQVAKLLGAKENDFREFLCDNKIMYRLGAEWVPYANHIDAGRFEVKTGASVPVTHLIKPSSLPRVSRTSPGFGINQGVRNVDPNTRHQLRIINPRAADVRHRTGLHLFRGIQDLHGSSNQVCLQEG